MIERYNHRGNPSIGFYATVTPEQVLCAPGFEKKDFFSTDSTETHIAKTELVGLFTAGNSNCILVADTITERERQGLEESGINFQVLETRENALGNMILANDKGAIISEKLSDKKEEIEEALEVEAEVAEIASLPNPGVCGVANNRGAVLHREATEEEAEKVKEVLGLEDVDIGTINLGSPYTGSGAVATDKHVLVGEDTSGPEIGRLDRILQSQE